MLHDDHRFASANSTPASKTDGVVAAPVDDVFSEVVSLVRVQGEMSTLLALHGDTAWPGEPGGVRMVLVHTGALWLHLEGLAPRAMAEGDLLLLMDPPAYRLCTVADESLAAPARPLPRDEAAPAWSRVGEPDQAERTRLLLGRMRFDSATGETLLRALPRVLHVARKQDDHQVLGWLDATAHFLALEIESPSVGTAVMVSRLVDLMFVQAARHWARHAQPNESGWLRALREPALARALQALHRAPAHDWTVESLAHEAHMSRSLFAERFSALMGQAPMAYLRQWRMQLAKRALRETRRSIAQIAEDVGYASETAFIKAFVNDTGHTPRRFRDEALATD